jgi:hypothetical protein
MGAEHDQLDLEIKQLERDKKAAELANLRAGERPRWVTPAIFLALLPVVGTFGGWAWNEAMKYRADYGASARVKELESQSSKINIEIQTLLSWKRDLQDEVKTSQERLRASQEQLRAAEGQLKDLQAKVEAKQEQIDKAYLRSKFASSEVSYAISHLSPVARDAERAGLDDLKRTLEPLPADTRRPIERIIANYRLVGDIVAISQRLTRSANEAVQSIPAGDWTQKFQAMPNGSIISNRRIMERRDGGEPAYYDVDSGEHLTAQQVEAAGGRPR